MIKGSHLSEETKHRISETLKGRKRPPFSEEARRNMSEARKGMKFSEEHKRRMSEVRKGRRFSPATEFKKGIVPWIKGRHHTPEAREKMSEAQSGENHPNYGKHLSGETKRKLSEARLRRKKKLGYLNSPETRKKMSASLKGKPSWNKGIELSEKHKRNLSMAKKGQHSSPQTEFKKGHIPWLTGHTKENDLRLRARAEARMGIPNPAVAGNKHWNWKGGVDHFHYGPDWHAQRSRARKRDGNLCVCCSAKGGEKELPVHHLIRYHSCFNNCLGNLMTLCPKCHKQIEMGLPIEMPKVRI